MTEGKEEIVCLAKSPATLNYLFQKLQEFNYNIVSSEQIANTHHLGIFPISNDTNLDDYYEFLNKTRKNFPNLCLIAVYAGRLKYKVNQVYNFGFRYLYQIPLEEDLCLNKIFEILPTNVDSDHVQFEHLFRVNIFELESQKNVPFDMFLYLPSNRKIVPYLDEGSLLDEKTLQKFKNNPNYNLYIKRTDISKYNSYCARTLKAKMNDTHLSNQQKLEAIQKDLSEFMSPFFTEDELTSEESLQALENLHTIFKEIDPSTHKPDEVTSALSNLANQKMTNVTHTQNVAAYCALFGILCGINKIKELRMGGLLHDIGLADMPSEVLGRDLKDLNEEQQAQYKLHPGNAKQEIQKKQMQVPAEVLDMILHHHERLDGSGYPYGKKSEEFSQEAKICAFADEFDKLTSVREGYKFYSPAEAIAHLTDSKSQVFDEKFMAPIKSAFAAKKSTKSYSELKTSGKVIVKTKAGQTANAEAAGGVPLKALAEKTISKKAPVTLSPDVEKEAKALAEELKAHFMKLVQM